jgi:hypothetical protein
MVRLSTGCGESNSCISSITWASEPKITTLCNQPSATGGEWEGKRREKRAMKESRRREETQRREKRAMKESRRREETQRREKRIGRYERTDGKRGEEEILEKRRGNTEER